MNTEASAAMTSKISYGAAAAPVIGSLTMNDIGILVGILCAVVTCAANVYFQHKASQRK